MEQWKSVVGHEGRYEVSDQGRVRGLLRLSPCGHNSFRRVFPRLLKPQLHSGGYQQVTLGRRVALVHSLVLAAFVGPRPKGKQAAHKDGNRGNNWRKNLRYATPLENARDKNRHGTVPSGEQNYKAKLTVEEIRLIRRSRQNQYWLAESYGVSQSCISKIQARRSWAHV